MARTFIDITAENGGQFKAYLAKPGTGSGPGLVLLQEIFGVNAAMQALADRYAEEGYVVLVPDLFWRLQPGVSLGYDGSDLDRAMGLYQRFDVDTAVTDIAATIAALRALPGQAGKIGTVGFCLGGLLAFLAAARTDVDCAVGYYGVGIEQNLPEAAKISCPMALHIAERDSFCPPEAQTAIHDALAGHRDIEVYTYPGCGHAFAAAGRAHFDKPAALMAYSRSLAMLRRVLCPIYDLGHLWDRHTYYEFGQRDVDATMATMVAEPYVNHVPTMTGGVGHDHLKRFYKYHFVNSNPDDTKLIPISRTIGTDRVVDEMLFSFTHTREIDWMLPGIEPTGRYVEIPLVAIVCFRGDNLFNEHIYWDQASVLVQIGKLDPALLPVAGIETARKVIDESLPSNALMRSRWNTSEGLPV